MNKARFSDKNYLHLAVTHPFSGKMGINWLVRGDQAAGAKSANLRSGQQRAPVRRVPGEAADL